MSDAVTFHDKLNPKLFNGQHLRPEVELQLKTIAEDFLQEMGIHDLDVRDITISGSNAAYSYTDHSDLDLHILVNMNDLPNDEVYREFFKAKKDLYNDSHDITIHGIPVELYIQDAAQPSVTLGEYSVKDNKWLRVPTKRRANFDQTATKSKYEKLLSVVNTALKSKNLKKLNKVLHKIKQYRQAGLDKGGEFGPENLAYKALRSQGYITKLYDLKDKLHSEILTIENMYQDPAKIQEDDEITNYKKLDKILKKLCEMVINGQESDKDYGMVGACVLDPDNRAVAGLNSPGSDNKRVHAERVAIEKYENKYGPVPKGSIVITTLSPCNESDDETAAGRVGESCTDYLNSKNIKKVYCGYIDPTQDNDQREFNLIETNDNDIRKVCKSFADTFLDEDYDPNGPPPGPEFKPTMPAGTVKVDVSDTYDWYKLGQHISNLKGLGKHDFGKGPPSTIMAFGDEDTEHKYIDALQKTGLTTTDIDPFDPKQPKGMKRQKVDPTYNVNEAFDQPYKLKWEKGDHGDIDAIAKLSDGNYLSIMFNKQSNEDNEEAWVVEFYRNNSQEVTGEGDAQRVFATVLSAIQIFIKKFKPNRISFSASKEVDPGQNAQSRARLYDSLVQRYARALGYRPFRADAGNKVFYELNRINKNVAEGVNTDFFDDPNNIDEIVDAFGYKFSVHKTLNRKSNLGGGDKTYRDVPGITIKAYDPEQPDLTIGHAKFVKETNRLGETWVESDETEVSEKYRGKGIAAMMYAVIKSLGFDIKPSQFQSNYGERMWDKWGKDSKHLSNSDSMLEASGYIPSEKEKNDPRFSTALTVDVKPDSIKKNAKSFYWKTSRAGIPPTAKTSGKIS